MSSNPGVDLTVQGAEKRDAGRGIARLSNATCRTLGILSGETVVIEGDRETVAKVWPGGEDGVIRIDADTRRNAGVNVGDVVTVRAEDVEDAERVTIELPRTPPHDDLADYVKRHLLDRPIRADERVHLERIDDYAEVVATDPEGTVRVTDATRLTVRPGGDPVERSTDASTRDAGGDSGRSRGEGSDEAIESTPTRPTETTVTYEDIGGLDDELDLIREMIELPLSEPELFRRLGVDPPKGVLLHGPPGTGKTLIAKAVANEVDAYFTDISGPEVVSKYKGDSEERIREKFAEAREHSPAILFIDEIDSIAGTRDEESDMENRVVAQLLTELDGLAGRDEVVVIGATNRVDALDPALRRGGRFDREIEIGVPNETGRREILDVHTRGMPIAEDVDLDALAERTHGFVGADVRTLATEAAMATLRRYRRDREARDRRAEADAAAGDESDDATEEGESDGSSTDEGDGSDESAPEGEPELAVTRADFEAAMAAVDPSAMREYVVETPLTTFDDVGGLEEVKAALRESVMWPLSYERLFEATRTTPPTGILMYGPPGTGKTLLARAIAGESQVNFIHVAGPELIDKYVGESEKAIREVFDRARQTAPTIIFFDEIDALAGRRGGEQDVTERVVSQLLTELDGLQDNPNLIVLAATNRYEALDPALLRPGRLESHVEVPLPDHDARRAVLAVHTEGKPIDGVDLEALAAETEGYSGADLEALVRQASLRAIRELAEEVGPEEADERADEIRITNRHFEWAKDRSGPRRE